MFIDSYRIIIYNIFSVISDNTNRYLRFVDRPYGTFSIEATRTSLLSSKQRNLLSTCVFFLLLVAFFLLLLLLLSSPLSSSLLLYPPLPSLHLYLPSLAPSVRWCWFGCSAYFFVVLFLFLERRDSGGLHITSSLLAWHGVRFLPSQHKIRI